MMANRSAGNDAQTEGIVEDEAVDLVLGAETALKLEPGRGRGSAGSGS